MEEIIKPYELKFSDLKLLSSTTNNDNNNNYSDDNLSQSKEVISSIIENLGPNGPGLITVTGVPHSSGCLRNILLPMARRLALLDTHRRNTLFKEHSLGSDVSLKNLDRVVSSFAMQLKYALGDRSNSNGRSDKEEEAYIERQCDLQNLGKNFKELGIWMMDLGLSLARICDRALSGLDLEQSLLESCTAKGRLIHYHSSLDNCILKEGAKRPLSTKRRATQPSTKNETTCENHSDMWQQWHYDYGIFTVLTSPMFMLPCHKQEIGKDENFCSSCEREYPSPSGHTFLKIFNKSKNRVQMVKADPESFIVQVGEAAEILSKGRLRANLHSVSKPEKIEEFSRETFVVFLQPRWDKTFSVSDYPIESFQTDVQDFEPTAGGIAKGSVSHYPIESFQSDVQDCEPTAGGICKTEQENSMLGQDLHKIVPPLSSRLKEGMTFAEFSQETTKQYYGGRGLQAKR